MLFEFACSRDMLHIIDLTPGHDLMTSCSNHQHYQALAMEPPVDSVKQNSISYQSVIVITWHVLGLFLTWLSLLRLGRSTEPGVTLHSIQFRRSNSTGRKGTRRTSLYLNSAAFYLLNVWIEFNWRAIFQCSIGESIFTDMLHPKKELERKEKT